MTEDALTRDTGNERRPARTAAMLNGNPGPMINSWASSGGHNPLGAVGTHRERAQSRHRHHALGRKPLPPAREAVNVEYSVVASSGDLAYTVGFERGRGQGQQSTVARRGTW